MDKKIVLINGSGGSGKDTFVSFCNNYVEVESISTVGKVKEAAKILGWTGGKTEKDRLFLSNLKLVWAEYNSGSKEDISQTVYAIDSVCKFTQGPKKLLFIHVREPKNIELIKSTFECETLLITSKRIDKITSNMADANVDKFKYDHVIHNDGDLEHLMRAAGLFVTYLFPEGEDLV